MTKHIDLFEKLPLLKRLVKLRSFQFLVTLPNILFFYILLLAGIFGNPIGNRNILIIFVWILWWFLLISVMVPFFGRIWCMVCPFPFFGEWFQRSSLTGVQRNKQKRNEKNHRGLFQKLISKFRHRVGRSDYFGLGKRWPKRMSNIWPQNIGFLLLCTFSVLFLTRPIISVIVLGGLFLIATVLAFIYRQRTFCTYLCPVSGFQGLYSMTSKLALRARDTEVCNRIKPGVEFSFDSGIAPCRLACPAGVDSSSYIALIAEGEYKRALELILENMPLAGVCGRICTHPCESECIRNQIDDSVSVCKLKRFVADKVNYEEIQIPKETVPVRDEKVAIIGSGPAGLTCAFYLAKRGYAPTIYESLPTAGGMLRLIPDYKLPKDIVDEEIEFIKRTGVRILTNKAVGKDITFDQLQDEYQSIFIATGAVKSRRLEIEGENLSGVYNAIDFLEKVNLNQEVNVGRNTVIIGGGNTAVDSARVALREGAEKVTVVYRRTREEMPAISEEVSAAEKEFINMQFLTSPLKIVGNNGKVDSLVCTKMKLGEPDETGRPRPVPVEDSEYSIPADTVIIAIGQHPDTSFLPQELNVEDGQITVDPQTTLTNLPGVFAGGDVVTGADVFVNAVAAGKKAAIAIDRYLQGEECSEWLLSLHPTTEKVDDLPLGVIHKEERVQPLTLPPESRVKDFEEIESSFTEEEALEEAERCLNCGICGECYRGGENKEGWSCSWFQRMGGMDRNNYCGLCFECVKSCPHDNIGLYWRPFGTDKKIKGYDEAFKAFIMIALAAAYSVVFLGPWGFLKDWANVTQSGKWLNFLGYAAGLWTLALAVVPGMHALSAWLGKVWAGARNISFKRVFTSTAYAFVPFGLFVWIAFSIPLIMANGSYIISVISDPFGWGWNLFGTANFPWSPLFPEAIPYIQSIILLSGLTFSIMKVNDVAKDLFSDRSQALKSIVPIALLLLVITVVFLSLFTA